MRQFFFLLSLSVAIFSLPRISYSATPLLDLEQEASANAARQAAAKQADLNSKADAAAAAAKKRAAQLANDAVQKLKDNSAKLEADLISGAAAVEQSLFCEFKRSADGVSVSGVAKIDLSKPENALVPIASLFPGDPNMQHLAVGFTGSLVDATKAQFELVDLNDGEKVIRSGNFANLNLPGISDDCYQKREIVYLNGGKAEVDATDSTPKVANGTLHALGADAKDIIGAAIAQ